MVLDVVDLLVGLMALAAQNDHITLLRVVHGPMNGLNPVSYHHIGRAAALQPRQDVGDDGLRVLGAGVVGGDHQKVRVLSGSPSHLGPLGPVPVAAAAEHRHGAALGKAPHRGEDILQPVGTVGVVD